MRFLCKQNRILNTCHKSDLKIFVTRVQAGNPTPKGLQ